jgi:hypothetical protein
VKPRTLIWLAVGIAAVTGALWFAAAVWPHLSTLDKRHQLVQGVAGLVLVVSLLVLQLRARREW